MYPRTYFCHFLKICQFMMIPVMFRYSPKRPFHEIKDFCMKEGCLFHFCLSRQYIALFFWATLMRYCVPSNVLLFGHIWKGLTNTYVTALPFIKTYHCWAICWAAMYQFSDVLFIQWRFSHKLAKSFKHILLKDIYLFLKIIPLSESWL